MATTPQFDRNDELEQQLWDFAYGLLDEDEADALQGRIDDHASVADLWVKVKDQVDLVASATRYDGPFIELARPDASTDGLYGPPPLDDIQTNHETRDVSRSRGARWTLRTAVNWLTPIASAAVLLFAVIPNWLPGLMPSLSPDGYRSRVAEAPAQPLQIVSPKYVDGEADYYVAFRSGEPVDIAVRDDSDQLLYKKRYVASEGTFKLPKPKNGSSLNLKAATEHWDAETTIEFLSPEQIAASAVVTPDQTSKFTDSMSEDFGSNSGGSNSGGSNSGGSNSGGSNSGLGREFGDIAGDTAGDAVPGNRVPGEDVASAADDSLASGSSSAGGYAQTRNRATEPKPYAHEAEKHELLGQIKDESAEGVQVLRRGVDGLDRSLASSMSRVAENRRSEHAYLSIARELGSKSIQESANKVLDGNATDDNAIDNNSMDMLSAYPSGASNPDVKAQALYAETPRLKRDSLRRVMRGDRELKDTWGLQVEPMRDHLEPGSRGQLAYRFDGHPAVRTLEFYFSWGDKVGAPIQVDLGKDDSAAAREEQNNSSPRTAGGVAATQGILAFDIPENVLGPAVVRVVGRSSTGQALRLAEELPVEPNMMRITTTFDNGVLAAELPSRVHILAEDGRGQGVAAQGHVVDNEGTEVATFETDTNGRGRFDFQPVAGRTYRFEAAQKNVVGPEILPDVRSFAALAPEKGNVQQVESSIRMRLNSTREAETVVSVVGRDENDRQVVASQSLSLKTGSNDVDVPLPENLTIAERVIGASSDGKLALFNKTLRPRVMDEYHVFDDQASRFGASVAQDEILLSLAESSTISEEQFLGRREVLVADDGVDSTKEPPSRLERSLASVQIITGSASAAPMQMPGYTGDVVNQSTGANRDPAARNRWLAGSALCLLVGMGFAAVFQVSRPRIWAPVVIMCGLTLVVVLVDMSKSADVNSLAETDESVESPESNKATSEPSRSRPKQGSVAGKIANESPDFGNRFRDDVDAEFALGNPQKNQPGKNFLSEFDETKSGDELFDLRMNATNPIAPALPKRTRASGRVTSGSNFYDGFGLTELSSGLNESLDNEAKQRTTNESGIDREALDENLLANNAPTPDLRDMDKRRATKARPTRRQSEYFLWVEQKKPTDGDPIGLAQTPGKEDNQKLLVEIEPLRRLSVGDKIQTPVRMRNLGRYSQTLGLNWVFDNRSVRGLFDPKMLHIEAKGVEERLLQLESVRPEASTAQFSVDSTNGRNQYFGTIEVIDPRVPLSLFASGVSSVAIDWKPEHWQPLSGVFWYYPSTAAELEGVSSTLRMQPVVTWDQVANVISSQALHLRWLEDAQVADVDTIRSTKQVLREWLARAESPEWRATLPNIDRTPAIYRVVSISEMTAALRVAKNVTHVNDSLYNTWEERLNDFTIDVDENDSQSVSASAYATWQSKDFSDEENQPGHRERLSSWSRSTRSAYLASLSCLVEERVADDVLQIVVNAQMESGEVPAKHLTATGSRGRSQSIESTALAAMAFDKANRHEERDRALNWLRSQRRNEKFGSSQASYLAFRALSNQSKNVRPNLANRKLYSRTNTAQGSATHESGIHEITLALPASDGNRPLGVAFPVNKNAQSIEFEFEGQVEVPVELRVLGFAEDPLRTDEKLNIEVRPSDTKIDLGDELTVAITATNASDEAAERVVATIPIPAGFVATDAGLADQRRDGRIDGYSIDGVQVLIFWEKIANNANATSELQLHGRAVGDVQAAAPSLHRLADPERRAWDKPWRITVDQ